MHYYTGKGDLKITQNNNVLSFSNHIDESIAIDTIDIQTLLS